MNLNTWNEISFGPHERQAFDYYVPEGEVKGVVMWVHGGGWKYGSKDNVYSVTKAEALIEEGYAVVKAGYRLSEDANLSEMVEDVRTTLNILLDHEYVQEKGLLVTGESAGGHLSIMSVLEHGVETGEWPEAVLNMVGPMDIIPSLDNPVGAAAYYLLGQAMHGDIGELYANSPIHQLPEWRESESYQNTETQFGFYANTTDTIVPTSAIEPFVGEMLNDFGASQVSWFLDTQDDPEAGLDGYPHNTRADHNVDSNTVLLDVLLNYADDVFVQDNNDVTLDIVGVDAYAV